MMECWQKEPSARPSCDELIVKLTSVLLARRRADEHSRDFVQLFSAVRKQGDPAEKLAAARTVEFKRAGKDDDDDPYKDLGDHKVYTETEEDKAHAKQKQDAEPWFHGALSRSATERALLSQGRASGGMLFLLKK
jgi:hypothetical protein